MAGIGSPEIGAWPVCVSWQRASPLKGDQMNLKKVTAVYFSPTRGTKRYVCALADLFSAEYESIDLTDFDVRSRSFAFGPDELVIVGAPVYYGRLPQVKNGLFDRLQGANTPAVFLVTYGNRAYDDALLEEITLCEANGFHGIAAGAFVAPHTFSEKIAPHRPDKEDLAQLGAFAQQIRAVLEAGGWDTKLQVPGNVPYREIPGMPFFPDGDENCTTCGVCVRVCPVKAIPASAPKTTDPALCIRCLACARLCPPKARDMHDPAFAKVIAHLEENLTQTEKKPEFFLLSPRQTDPC